MTDAATIHSVDEIFTQLSPQDENILISLPYRIGLYVSYSDISGGWDAQEKELQSLSGILREYAEDFCKTEFTQKVLMEALMRRTDWPSWAQGIDTVPDEAGRLITLLAPMSSTKELNAFKEVMVDIALSVAMAFQEGRGATPAPVKRPSFLSGLFGKRKAAKQQQLSFGHANISPAEQAALQRVCTAMNYPL